ncbi:FAD-dependent monooxygenase [Pseudonocardia sp. TRM90224]|uniref:FAD-dependent monooxygenase n=1 Tax=Pseudonocardia sp. TRM90224 TaxID=2812678 RepID=UPI001E56956C|nr:FAD-dependent monooxygenase [Pseudonocardia sp. TRM90224]
MSPDVVVVGAGPTGLMVACELRLHGVDVVVLEQLPAPTGRSKALGLFGRAARTLDYRGLLERFDSVPVPEADYGRWAHLSGIGLDVAGLVGSAPAGHFPAPLPVRQAEVERVLEDRARELGGLVQRGHELVGFSEGAEDVTIDVLGPDGPYQLRARYLVGCDGARSRVRARSGIGFSGSAATVVCRLGDVEISGSDDVPIGMRRTATGLLTVVPLDGEVHRVVSAEWGGQVDRDGPMTLEELHASVRRVHGAELAMREPRWLSRFTDAARQADRYRAGRALLAGDAAHIQFPAGGPGMTTGLQDAANLGWKLAAEVRGWAPPGLLDTYHAERHPVAERTLSFSRAQSLLLAPGEQMTALRDLLTDVLAHEQALRYVVDRLWALDLRYDLDDTSAHPLVGCFAPDLPLTTDRGSTRLAVLMHGGQPLLLDPTPDGRLATDAAAWADRVTIVRAASSASLDGLLVRPDGYVAWADDAANHDADRLGRALSRWFGPASLGDATRSLAAAGNLRKEIG